MKVATMKIQPTDTQDIPALQALADAVGLFPGEMLPGMVEPFLAGRDGSRWLTCREDGAAIGLCYAAQEQLAEGTWNMLALAVLPERQGRGAGAALVRRMEDDLRGRARILIVDTSGTPAFRDARHFYRAQGYEQEARIRDYWAEDDDKVTFRKAL